MHRADATRLGVALLLVAASALALPPSLRDRLPQLPAATQRMLAARDAQWQAMTPAQRQAFHQRLQAWDALPQAVRRERRESWLAWRALPADQQMQVRAAAMAFAALDVTQQQALRAQFAQDDTSQRRGWLLGPALGASLTALQPLLMQVPADERAALLATLRAMDPAQRDALGVLAQRTAPAQRDALRRELISTSAANRGRWLDTRLAR